MTEREVRMRAIEALAAMGVREAGRLTKDAEVLAGWVMGGDDTVPEDKVASPPRAAPKAPPKADKD